MRKLLNWINSNDLQGAAQCGAHLFSSEVFTPFEIEWSDILDNIDKCRRIRGNDTSKILSGSIIVHRTLNKTIDSIARKVREVLRERVVNKSTTTHVYTSFYSGAETFGPHQDTAHVLFFNLIGMVQFEVNDSSGSHKYVMKPGDVIFVPAGLMHDTYPLTPRASLSFGAETNGL